MTRNDLPLDVFTWFIDVMQGGKEITATCNVVIAKFRSILQPVANLDCPDLIAAFEEKRKANPSKVDPKRKAPGTAEKEKEKKRPKTDQGKDSAKGFDRGLKPERIIGATDASGELMFLVKW